MAFTYDLSTNTGKVRLNLGDTQENVGPRPDKRNFSDEEIDHFISVESDGNNAATALGFEILASEWTSYALSETEGEVSFNAQMVADKYMIASKFWRAKPGGGTSGGALVAGVIVHDFMEKGDDTSE